MHGNQTFLKLMFMKIVLLKNLLKIINPTTIYVASDLINFFK